MLLPLYPSHQMKWFLFLDISLFVFLFFNLVQATSSLSFLEKLSLYLVIFISYYVLLWWKDWRFLLASFVGICSFILLAIYINEAMLMYLFIFSDASGKVRVWPHSIVSMLMIASSYIVVFSITTGSPFSFISTYLAPILFLQLILPLTIRFIKRTNSLERDLAIAESELVKEEERNRIARDLHDTLGHTLAVIKFKSELAIRLVEKDQEMAKKEMVQVLDTARSASKQVREVVTSLKHVSIDSVIVNGHQLFKGTLLAFSVCGESNIPSLTEMKETMIALSIREALVNCYKHSRADRVQLSFSKTSSILFVSIQDDGIGMDVEQPHVGEGLSSMKERMHLIHAKIKWVSEHHKGTTVTLEIPLQTED